MPTSGDLKSGDSLLHYPQPLECQWTPPPPQINPAPKWVRTLYEVLHEVHTIKFHFHHCNDEITGFSLRILVAGERCNFIGEYCERGSMSEFKN